MTTEDRFQDVRVVAEIRGTKSANDHIAMGWRLLKVLSPRDAGGEYVVYVLGWPYKGPMACPADSPAIDESMKRTLDRLEAEARPM